MKNANLVSVRKFADMMEVSETAVRKWMAKGIIDPTSVDKRGSAPMIDVKKAKADVDQNRDKKKRIAYESLPEGSTDPNRHKQNGEKAHSRQKLEGNASDVLGMDMSTEALMKLSYNDLIKLKEMKTVQIKNAELLETEGRLVSKEMVYKKLFDFGKIARESILASAERCIDKIMIAKSREEVMFILKSELVAGLEILTKPVENAGI